MIVPETLTGRSILQFLSRRSLFWLKAALLFAPGVVVTDIPLLPEAAARAILYAKSLHAQTLQALFFSSDPEDLESILDRWAEWPMDVALAVIDAPFRDIKGPLLDEVRALTGRGNTIVTVILPELVVSSWWEQLLHNQVGLYIKRALVFEPNVVVTSVPPHLGVERDEARDPAQEPTV